MKTSGKTLRLRRLAVAIPLTVLVAGSPKIAGAAGPQCTDDIELVNGAGCAAPCCFQDPPQSGHYVFTHTAVEKIDIRGNPAGVVSVSFPNLQTVAELTRISFNQPGAITRISFPKLRRAGTLDIVGNSELAEIDAPILSSVESTDFAAYLRIQSNAALTSLNMPLLEQVLASEAGNAFIELRFNHSLEEIDLPRLRTVEAAEEFSEAYIFIGDNNAVRHVSMDSLLRLSAGEQSISYLIIDDMLQLDRLSFSQLTELLPTGGPDDFSELTIGHSPSLTDFVFPSLQRVTVLQLGSLRGTRRAMFPRLSELGYLWVFRSCQDAASTMKMYVCSEQPIDDILLNDDGLCGPTGYQLHSESPEDEAECDASSVCASFTPELTECRCGAPGLCVL